MQRDRMPWLLASTLLTSGVCFAQGSDANQPNTSNAAESSVTVTGHIIRGVENSASPLRTFDKEAIEASGFVTTHEFMNSLPQNFRGGVSEAGGGPAQGLVQTGPLTGNNAEFTNLAFANSANLRGLGASSTLVLLEGMRIAPVDGGSSTDLLGLPLSAIEQIDILSDSGSALYGSDAMAGVINYHLRRDYSGQESRVRFGTATDGGGSERQASQTFGRNWGKGSVLLNYEFYEREKVDAADRSYTRGLPSPTYLLPGTDRHSLLATARQEIAPRVEIFGTGIYSKRLSHSKTSNDVGPLLWINDHHGQAEQYNVMGGGSIDTGETWRHTVALNYSRNNTSRRQGQLRGSMGSASFVDEERTSVESADVKSDGALFEWRGHATKLAIGAHYRQESYDPSGSLHAGRHSTAVFSELLLPVALDSERVDSPRVEMSLAGRYEDYSDFGDTADPKFGVVFVVPSLGVNVRSTWGTSFDAPSFPQLRSPLQGLLFPIPNASGGMTLAAIANGGNPDLRPEEARTFTAGFDIRPTLLQGFSMSATYFDIDDRHRIEASRALFDALVNPLYAGIVDQTPDPAFLTRLGDQPESFNPTGASWASAQVLVDDRFLNIAKLKVTGIDLLLSYELPLDSSQLTVGLDSTYLHKKDIQLSSSSPRTDVLNTVDNPVDLRARGSVTWRYGSLSVAGFVNYADNYVDSRIAPAAEVKSWTTLDLNLRYRLPFADSWIRNAELSLIGQNVLGNDPPFVRDLDPSRRRGVNFDAANASAVGPTVAAQVTVSW